VEFFAFVEKVNLGFDLARVLKVFPNTIVHPAPGK
jgi:hypothetical protein